jgi:hypothetical protein
VSSPPSNLRHLEMEWVHAKLTHYIELSIFLDKPDSLQ